MEVRFGWFGFFNSKEGCKGSWEDKGWWEGGFNCRCAALRYASVVLFCFAVSRIQPESGPDT